MDQLDRQIINELQDNFPLAPSPYNIIADRLQITVDQLWNRITALKESGTIRRIGVSLDSRKLGYSSTLAAVSVPDDQVDSAAEIIGRYPEVTHSYQRDDKFNIWFTLIAHSQPRIEEILAEIAKSLNLSDEQLVDVPVLKLFKLDARFKAADNEK